MVKCLTPPAGGGAPPIETETQNVNDKEISSV